MATIITRTSIEVTVRGDGTAEFRRIQAEIDADQAAAEEEMRQNGARWGLDSNGLIAYIGEQ